MYDNVANIYKFTITKHKKKHKPMRVTIVKVSTRMPQSLCTMMSHNTIEMSRSAVKAVIGYYKSLTSKRSTNLL